MPYADRTTLNNLTPNLDIGDVADPALRLAFFQYIVNLSDSNYAYLQSLVTSGTLSPIPPDFMGRQAIINGNLDVWQRGTSFAATGSLQYTADRWCALNVTTNQASTISRQDGSGVPGSIYCIRYQRNAGQTGVNSSSLTQSIESADSKKLIGKKLTLSFWARIGAGSSFSTLTANIYSGTGTDQNVLGVFTGPVVEATLPCSLTTVWQKFTLTTGLELAAAKSQIAIGLISTPSGTAGASDYFEIAQVQLNAGDVSLPFQPRSFGDELAMCQRYYEKSYDYAVSPGTASSANGSEHFIAVASTFIAGKASFKSRKRIVPTTTIYAPISGSQNSVNNPLDGTAFTVTSISTLGETGITLIAGSGFTQGNVYRFQYTSDAEI